MAAMLPAPLDYYYYVRVYYYYYYPKKLNSTKQSKFQTDIISIRSFTKFFPFAMTNRTKNGHDKKKPGLSNTVINKLIYIYI
jgi:hypothetical protein